jgi:tetratricopeptide (TPR) repeat protein
MKTNRVPMKIFVRLLMFGLCVVLSGCVTPTYKPDANVMSRLSVAQAQTMFDHWEYRNTAHLTRGGTALWIAANPYWRSPDAVYFLPDLRATTESDDFAVWKVGPAGAPYQCLTACFKTKEAAQQFADAVYVLSHATVARLHIPEDPAVQAEFEKAAQLYRAASEKPALPEEARACKVQAETAVKKQQYDDAIGFYKSALELAPWWPEGHFNCALLMGKVGDYIGAIREMERYLALVPDAPDARQAQDKIYSWKGQLH